MAKGRDRASDVLERGRRAWPTVAVDADAFAAHVAELDDEGEPHADVYLAFACGHGDAAALALFDQQILGEVGLYVRRIDPSPELADEVRQTLRERLLVARGAGRPRILDYAGRGALGAWVRISAVRAAMELRRQRGGHAPGAAAASPTAKALDPEATLMLARHQSEYQEALRGALGELSAKERNLLRMHFVDGLSVDRIGKAYRVHRATAARWIQSVRQQLLDETYRRLGGRLRLSASEFASLTAAVQSQLHLSLTGLLGS